MPETQTPGDEPAQDVLAAEAFALPGPDPSLHHDPVALPADPTGIEGAHDVLAAEEFAMPAPTQSLRAEGASARRPGPGWRLGVGVGAAALLALLARRLLRRR